MLGHLAPGQFAPWTLRIQTIRPLDISSPDSSPADISSPDSSPADSSPADSSPPDISPSGHFAPDAFFLYQFSIKRKLLTVSWAKVYVIMGSLIEKVKQI